MRRLVVPVLTLVLTACGGGGGAGLPTVATPSEGPGSLAELDPVTGALGSATLDAATIDVPQRLAQAPAVLLFRRVLAGSGMQGDADGDLGAASGSSQTWRMVSAFELGCTEVTQAQWTALATAAGCTGVDLAPWQQVAPAAAIGGIASGATLPAYGLSVDLIATVIAGFNARQGAAGPHLRLPTAAEWEHACRAGSAAPYAWGRDEAVATVALHAVVRETRLGDGATAVAGIGILPRRANALGFYDMAGNVCEPVSDPIGADAALRGGSWLENLVSARCAAVARIDPDLPHATTGLRLVLVR